ncbi:hypothetical protein AAE478_004091 [Parahypoxylon ruwenzoriense]
MASLRILVVSLGNQGPYYECLHSAGHFALVSTQKYLAEFQPPFSSQRHGGERCLVSEGPRYTMIQSPTMMNISGRWVAKTWKEMLRNHQLQPSELGLVIVHDDLEEDFARVRSRRWSASHRGHNGVKSIEASLKLAHFPGARWSRISVGIGRPVARDRELVSDYVLNKMTIRQKDTIDTHVGPKVSDFLTNLQKEWEGGK